MKNLIILTLIFSSFTFAEELGAEDKEILKELEFFSNMEILEDDISLEDLEEMEDVQSGAIQKGLNE